MFKLRAELRAHTTDVRGVASSSTGQIATASRDKTVALWDKGGLEPVKLLRGHDHFVNAVAFADAEKLVTASSDNTLRVWDVKSGECTTVLRGHEGPVCAVAVLPGSESEKRVISASWDKTARVWDLISGTCLTVLKGHEAAVWGVAGLPDGRLVTVAADKTVRVWNRDGSQGTQLPASHTDVVRDVVAGPNGGFVTVANDSAMVYWSSDCAVYSVGHRISDLHDGSYIYSIDAREEDAGKWTFVTGGEDNAVRVVEADLTAITQPACIQTLMHPGTVWSACLCPGGDLVTACSDGVARVFTRDLDAVADADVLSTFEKAVSERQVNTRVIGGVDVSKLPEVEKALSTPGKKDGENKIVRTAAGTADVYMWSAAESKWTKVGQVVDNPAGPASSGTVNGKSYDFTFEVEVGEGGKKEKLGYNRGENPYAAAQRFIDENELSQEFIDQIAQFIEQQVPADALRSTTVHASDPLTGGSRYVPGGSAGASTSRGDPLTGGSRYVPGGGATASSNRGDPLTGGSRYVPGGSGVPPGKLPPPRKLIPHSNGIVLYKSTDQIERIQAKLSDFNTEFAKNGSDLALSQEEATVFGASLMPKLKTRGGAVSILDNEDCTIVEKLLKWPTSHAFPVLDVARLVISLPTGCAYFFGSRNGEVLVDILRHLSAEEASAPVYIMGCRFLCNMFGNRVSGTKVLSEQETIIKAVTSAAKSSNRRARETVGSLMINYAVSLHEGKASPGDKALVIRTTANLITAGEKDEEVLYRLMIAMGTLLCSDEQSALKGVELGAAAAAAEAAPVSARLQQVATEIATLIAS